jgi:hypothetical protein
MEQPRYKEHVRSQVRACLAPIRRHQREIDMRKRIIDLHQSLIDEETRDITLCRRQAKLHESELDRATVLPGIFRYEAKFWDTHLAPEVRHDKALARVLIRSPAPPNPFPDDAVYGLDLSSLKRPERPAGERRQGPGRHARSDQVERRDGERPGAGPEVLREVPGVPLSSRRQR